MSHRLALVGCLLVGTRAFAEPVPLTDDTVLTLDEAWPDVPADRALSLEQRVTGKATDWGNHVGNELDQLSRHHASLRVDVGRRRAKLHLGGGNEHLKVDFDSNWLFADGKAYVKATFAVDLQGHHFELELPDMDLSRDNYKGEGMMEVNVSVLEKRF